MVGFALGGNDGDRQAIKEETGRTNADALGDVEEALQELASFSSSSSEGASMGAHVFDMARFALELRQCRHAAIAAAAVNGTALDTATSAAEATAAATDAAVAFASTPKPWSQGLPIWTAAAAGDGPDTEGEGWLSFQTWTCPITGVDVAAPGQESGGCDSSGGQDDAHVVCLLGTWGVEAYVGAVLRFWLRDGIAMQVREARAGLAEFVSPHALAAFAPAEVALLCGGEPAVRWSREELAACVVPDSGSGYTKTSPT